MSVRVMSLVWDFPMSSPIRKLVLLKLADNASDDGRNAYPAVASIARASSLSRRGVQMALRGLEADGLIEVERYESDATPRSYRVNVEALRGGVTDAPPPAHAMRPPPAPHAPPPRTTCARTILEPSSNHPSDTALSRSPANGDVGALSPAPPPRNGELRGQAREILAFLNEKAGRSYRPVDATLKPIEARLRSGATVANCRGVIARKVREWNTDPKMVKYLRPETLFGATKFESYLGERAPEPAVTNGRAV